MVSSTATEIQDLAAAGDPALAQRSSQEGTLVDNGPAYKGILCPGKLAVERAALTVHFVSRLHRLRSSAWLACERALGRAGMSIVAGV